MAGPFQKARNTFMAAVLRGAQSPRRISFSVAVGVFWGVTPFWGLHTLLAVLSAFLLRLNTPAVLFGTLVSNPWFAPFLIFVSLEFGSWILYQEGALLSLKEIRGLVQAPNWPSVYREILLPYFWGSLSLSFLLAFCSFWICWWVARAYRASQ